MFGEEYKNVRVKLSIELDEDVVSDLYDRAESLAPLGLTVADYVEIAVLQSTIYAPRIYQRHPSLLAPASKQP